MRLIAIAIPASRKLHVHDGLHGQIYIIAVAMHACIGIIVIAI